MLDHATAPRPPGLHVRLLVAAVLAALTFALAACGDSDDDGGAGEQARGGSGQPAAPSDGRGQPAAPADTGGPAARGGDKGRAAREGGGEDGDGGSQKRPDRSSGGPALVGDRAQARAGAGTIDDLYGDLRAAVDAGVAAADVGVLNTLDAADEAASLAKVCDLMSENARRETIDYANRSAGLADVDWTCEKATGLLLRRSGQRGNLRRATRVTVVGVNVDGDRATATVRFGGAQGALRTISLVKEDGEWKLGDTPGGG